MLRSTLVASVFLGLAVTPAFAATVDGQLVSVDSDNRRITLETGVILTLTEYVSLDGLAPGQLVRVTYTDETIDVTAVDILEYPPMDTDTPSSDEGDLPTGDLTDPLSVSPDDDSL